MYVSKSCSYVVGSIYLPVCVCGPCVCGHKADAQSYVSLSPECLRILCFDDLSCTYACTCTQRCTHKEAEGGAYQIILYPIISFDQKSGLRQQQPASQLTPYFGAAVRSLDSVACSTLIVGSFSQEAYSNSCETDTHALPRQISLSFYIL